MKYKIIIGTKTYTFSSLKELLAKATPLRSADVLASIAAENQSERVAAQMCLADLPLKVFLEEDFVAAKDDEVTRLIQKQFDAIAFQKISHLTVGSFREWLLQYSTDAGEISSIC